MIPLMEQAIVTIGVGVVVSALTYFINKWLDDYFRK